MTWPKPTFSRNQINKAGDILINSQRTPEEFEWAMTALNNWRSCHGYPINTFQSTLRDKLKALQIASDTIVAQRLKRTPSIIKKLERFRTMKLARMQDIGGLRAVVTSLKRVRDLEGNYCNNKGRFKHELVDVDDYIKNPKKDGYRGVHMIYRYKNDSVPEYNGLLIELQIRTKHQHVWATAVETMGTFLNFALKSSEGPEEWLSFFSLAGSAFAHLERCQPVPGYEQLSAEATYSQTVELAAKLKVHDKLQAFRIATSSISQEKQKSSFYHLIILNLEKKLVSIRSFGRGRIEQANLAYTDMEKRITSGEPMQAVLVAAGSIDSLKRAYPNYFLDTREFLNKLDQMKNALGNINK